MAEITRAAIAYFAAMAAQNRRINAAQWDRTPVAGKPKPPPKAPVKRAKVKAARKQRRKQRG